MDILVFKTNIAAPDTSALVAETLSALSGVERWSIDFSDVDKVLRIESSAVRPDEVMDVVRSAGFRCEELD